MRRQVKPTVAGRNPTLAVLAEPSAGLDHLVVDASSPHSMRKQLRRGDVLINTVGTVRSPDAGRRRRSVLPCSG
ncbi:hypothetical protein ACFQ6E_37965 [Streptomyces sp. NPDC056462]|uniref:hypothetical protein n=1 Tax=Streptomyces sp. NPDC056462 TaxID=3345826 RepID=UPI00368A33F9